MVGLEPAGEKPFLEFGVAEAGAAVVIDFIDFALGCFNAVVIAVVPLPPALASGGAFTEAVVRPGLQNFSNNVLAVLRRKDTGTLTSPPVVASICRPKKSSGIVSDKPQ